MLCLVHLKVNIWSQATNCLSKILVGTCGFSASTRNNQRGTSLIDKDGVNLVDDGIMMSTLNTHLWASNHVVAQVVKAKLRVCAVGNICLIRRLFKAQAHTVLQKTNANTQELVDGAHPLTVSFSQVIVDSNNVNAFTA